MLYLSFGRRTWRRRETFDTNYVYLLRQQDGASPHLQLTQPAAQDSIERVVHPVHIPVAYLVFPATPCNPWVALLV